MVRISVLAAACVASLASAVALAQASAPMSREQVKAETRAAQKAGELTPAGGGEAPAPRRRAEWGAAHRQVRQSLPHGPGGWRASALPR